MQEVEICEIRITRSGLLQVKTNPDQYWSGFPFVYRASCGVYWNEVDECFEPREIIEWSIAQWYSQIISTVQSELEHKLVLTKNTVWRNVPEDTVLEIKVIDNSQVT